MTKPRIESSWPASKVSLWPIDKIIPYENNPRTHPPAQIDLLARSMLEDGVTTPILVDEEGVIIAGHGRLMASMQNGFKKYPVAVARGWTEERKRAVRVKDNQYGLMSGWDRELIRGEIAFLSGAGEDVSLLGFGDAQLVQFTTLPGPPSEFQAFGEDIPVTHRCPKCGYTGSGDWRAKPQEPAAPKKGNGKNR